MRLLTTETAPATATATATMLLLIGWSCSTQKSGRTETTVASKTDKQEKIASPRAVTARNSTTSVIVPSSYIARPNKNAIRRDAAITPASKINDAKAYTVAGFKLPVRPILAKKGDWVWAAAAKAKRPTRFIFRRSRIKDVRMHSAVVGFFGEIAPSAFIYPSTSDSNIQVGQTVLAHSGAVSMYARVVSKSEEKYTLVTGRAKPRKLTKTADELFLIKENIWQAGAVVRFKDGQKYRSATIILVDGDTVFFTTYSDGLDHRKKTELTLIDVGRQFKVGESVYAEPSGGFSPNYQRGRVSKVDENHTRYVVKTGDGKIFESNFKTLIHAP